jgi:hypothetical protein
MAYTGTPPSAVRRGVFVLVLLVSALVLFTPAREVPAGPQGIDKVIHVLLFAALVTYAAASEPVQSLPVIGRSTSLADWVADVGGVLLGYAGTVASTRLRSASRSSSGSG